MVAKIKEYVLNNKVVTLLSILFLLNIGWQIDSYSDTSRTQAYSFRVMDDYYSSLSSKISNINAEISNLKSEMSNTKSKISDIKSEISRLDSEVSDIDYKVSRLKSEISLLPVFSR